MKSETIIYDIETDGLLDTMTRIHCVVMKVYRQNRIGIFVSPENLDRATAWVDKHASGDLRAKVQPFDKLWLTGQRLVCHNQLGFDLAALKMFGIELEKHNEIVDTLVLSRYLYPDRPAHNLKYWGEQVFRQKMPIEDWSALPIEDYLQRCVIDVQINERVYRELRSELRDPELHEGLKLAHAAYDGMCRQERKGIRFNQREAIALLSTLDTEMEEMREVLEPMLGEAPLPKSKQPTYPKKPFKADGTLSATALSYGRKLGITDPGHLVAELARPPRVLMAPIRLESTAQIKEFLFQKGWKPTMWRLNDITKEKKKRSSPAKLAVRAEKYVKDVWSGPYRERIWELLNVPADLRLPFAALIEYGDTLRLRAQHFIIRHPRKLPMSPMLIDPVSKAICPNLAEMEGDLATGLVRWMSLRNRRGVLAGWLANRRLARDGRITAASSGWTNTFRQKHTVIANLPAADEKVVYGKAMRSLFIPPAGRVFVGYDASGLEARIAGHLAAEFDGGAYAREVLDGDIHAKNAAAYSTAIGREVSRGEGKSPTYALMFGCTAPKVASMFTVDKVLGQKLVDAFWDANPGLKAAKEKIEAEWASNGRQFVRSLDGRKIWTRSPHSLLNAVIQSSGAIIMDRSFVLLRERLGRFSHRFDRVAYFHDEYLLEVETTPSIWPEGLGKAAVKSITQAGEFYKLRVPLTGEFKIGTNYSEVH
jgi:DNA polymerase I-like protein with 3'-5' exonuclease and polymerase domains